MIGTKAVGATRTAPARGSRLLATVLPGLWVLAVLALELTVPPGLRLEPLLAAAPALALALGGECKRVLLGGACALLALVPMAKFGPRDPSSAPLGTCCSILIVLVACGLANRRRQRLVHELDRTRSVAVAAQRTLLRPLPHRIDQLALAGGQLSASRDAVVGGDLYEAVATPYGVRIVIGDVRGHGLAALDTVAAVLGSFREAAHDEAELAGVLRRLERTLRRHLRERVAASASAVGPGHPVAEEFVTVLLLEVRPSGEVMALNCGHPWPFLLVGQGLGGPAGPRRPGPYGTGPHGTGRRVLPHRSSLPRVRQLAPGESMPPLGLFPLPELPAPTRCVLLLPGEALVLYTDGAEDARNAAGDFFPLAWALTEAARGGPVHPQAVVDRVRGALLRHTDGRLGDDAALLVLRNDRSRVPAQSPVPVPLASDARLS
ncbi:PP2C family protein-serine/threonine phosphatase [Streptomyces sp. 71268]|uniref:PP2C family protein-serine/threonine phosphatase n=1 Tax=Streptomyces sp. 71268 TaxID=3002640 RepID=UPI0023F9AA2B|nr:PP2C family protein-serine/threonine phosphatase [Streptomyces sp. 71268]WEV24539.1 PP2C family protein-serine/threonine phosphatase [Streptomyces sp. 71268]